MTAIRTGRRDDVRTIECLIGWPENPTSDWHKGFLAGIFDAEGSYSGSLRIPNTDPEIISRTVSSLESLGFDYVVEPTNLAQWNRLRPAARRAAGSAAVLPHRRSGDHQEAVDRGRGAEERRQAPGGGDRTAGAGPAHVRHHHRHRRLHRQRGGEPQLLRPEFTYLPGPRRGRGLRHQGGRQGQRARAGAQEDGLADLVGRAHRHGHQRGLLPAGRGPLSAHAGHHRRAQGRRQPVLHLDQGHLDPAGHRAARGGGRGHRRGLERLGRIYRQRAMAICRAGHARPGADGSRHAPP